MELSGFGLAWRLHSDNIKKRSRKPCYIAWEVLSSGSGYETPTFAADMWSLGCGVYELLGALPAFKRL
jgi:serine/threonine protein kinase